MSIDSIYVLGDDALGNTAELNIVGFPLFDELKEHLKFRTKTINIPEFSVGTYEVQWKTQKFEKPSGTDESSKEFSFEFRVDKYYTVYKALMSWYQYVCNSDTGAMAEDVSVNGSSNIRTDIQVRMVESNGLTTNEGFSFKHCFPKSIDGISYSVDSGEPIEVSVTMSFVKCIPL